jgi:4-carboxymuconolactone decarboxylase
MKKFVSLACLALALALPVAAAESVRFPPISPDKFTPPQKEFADLLQKSPRNGNVNNPPFKVYFRSPEFGLEAIHMSDYLRWGTSYDPRQTELIILLAARQSQSGYIWHAHYAAAMKAGLNPQIPAAIAAGKRPQGMKEDEALLYDLITQIYRDHALADATYDAAVKKFGEKGVTDAIGLAGYYGITAMALTAAKATYPAGGEPKLETLAQVFPKSE